MTTNEPMPESCHVLGGASKSVGVLAVSSISSSIINLKVHTTVS